MDALIVTALDADRPLIYFCIELVLNNDDPDDPETVTIRSLDGFGAGASVTFSSLTFYGSNDIYGTVALPDALSDSIAGEVGAVEIVIRPPSDAAALVLQVLAGESSTIRIWGPGAINRSTGANIAAPDLIFTGFVADAVLTLNRGRSQVALMCVDGFQRLLDRGDGYSANGPAHKSIRSGELGFDFITEVEKTLYWGSAAPRDSLVPRMNIVRNLHTIYTGARARD